MVKTFCLTAFQRSSGFSIYTYENNTFNLLNDPKSLVYHHNPLDGCPSQVQMVTVNNVTQGIAFINERPRGYTSNCQGDDLYQTAIEICEVKVMGWY